MTLPMLRLLNHASAIEKERYCQLILEGDYASVSLLLKTTAAAAMDESLASGAARSQQARTQLEDLPESRALESLHLFADTIYADATIASRASGLTGGRDGGGQNSRAAGGRSSAREAIKARSRRPDDRELIAILLRRASLRALIASRADDLPRQLANFDRRHRARRLGRLHAKRCSISVIVSAKRWSDSRARDSGKSSSCVRACCERAAPLGKRLVHRGCRRRF